MAFCELVYRLQYHVVQLVTMISEQHSREDDTSCDWQRNRPEVALTSVRVADIRRIHAEETGYEGTISD